MNKIYRGKKRYGKGWAYGVPMVLDMNGYKVTAIVRCAAKSTDGFVLDYDEVIPETVGQFTDNHDYYTKEKLFEGDIMERDEKRFVIKFSGCGFVGEMIGKPNFTVSLCLLCHLTSEFRLPGKKIGNIHDNPAKDEIQP